MTSIQEHLVIQFLYSSDVLFWVYCLYNSSPFKSGKFHLKLEVENSALFCGTFHFSSNQKTSLLIVLVCAGLSRVQTNHEFTKKPDILQGQGILHISQWGELSLYVSLHTNKHITDIKILKKRLAPISSTIKTEVFASMFSNILVAICFS